jgi:hypothetical protein
MAENLRTSRLNDGKTTWIGLGNNTLRKKLSQKKWT